MPRDYEEGVAEAPVLRVRRLVQCVPRDEHRHDDGLAGAGGHLVRHAEQPRVGVLGEGSQLVLDPRVAQVLRCLGQVDRRLKRLDLAEEEATLSLDVCPVLEELAGRRRNTRPSQLSPSADPLPDLVDEPVLLDPVAGPLVERELTALLLRLRDRHEVRGRPPAVDDLVGGPLVVEPEVPRRRGVRRVEDGVLDDNLGSGHLGIQATKRSCRVGRCDVRRGGYR